MIGGQLLWIDYFYYVYEKKETLYECIKRLQHDFRKIEMNLIKKYINVYGCPFFLIIE